MKRTNCLRTHQIGAALGGLLLCAQPACTEDRTPQRVDAGAVLCPGTGTSIICEGGASYQCRDGEIVGQENCLDNAQLCNDELGCVTCQPGSGRCDGEQAMTCRSDGSGYQLQDECGAASGTVCVSATGECLNLCEQAEATFSYQGCEYWPTITANSDLVPEFSFAVVVANPQTIAAHITVARGSLTAATATIEPGEIEAIELPWITDLKTQPGIRNSAIVEGGAYKLTSTVPISVYQFNPLEFRLDADCADEPMPVDDDQCFSFTNDASLLLPSHVLTGNYIALSRPSLRTIIETESTGISRAEIRSPGFISITNVEDVAIDVEVATTAAIRPGGASVPAMLPNSTQTFTIGPGDVLQLLSEYPRTCNSEAPSSIPPVNGQARVASYCRAGDLYDFTGTEIRASGRLSVLAGHNCAFVPHDRWACDHLEEAMLPLESWGKRVLVAVTELQDSQHNLVRVVSGDDGNRLVFIPEIHAPITLNRGEMVELEADEDFLVEGSESIAVAQFLIGQGIDGIQTGAEGDPSMGIVSPTEQFRQAYTFLAPTTFTNNYVNVTAPVGAEVNLDGEAIDGWRLFGADSYQTTRVEVSGGSHRITSAVPFGIMVYGSGQFASYMYPGGLNLEAINAPH